MKLLAKNKIEMDMCARPMFGNIVKFSLPLIFSGILQLLYNAADIIVVGQFDGHLAMTAVGSTGALVNLITNLFIGLSVGALSGTAINIGAQNKKNVDEIVHTSMVISVIAGVFLAIFGFFLSEQFLIWLGTPSSVLPLSTLYLKIFFLGMPFNLLYNFGSSILRACGDTKRPLLFLTIAGIVNVVLNLVFVIKFKLGVAGVAISTVISQAISSVLVVLCLMRRKGYGRLELKKLKIHKQALLTILKIGLPAGLQSTVFSLSNVIIQSSINSMGDLVMGGNAAAANIEGFVYISMNAISQATLTFTGQNFGAGKRKNVNLVLFQTTLLVTLIGVAMGTAVYFLGAPLLGLYNSDPAIIAYGIERLSVIATSYFLCGIMEVFVGALRGIGKSTLPMFVSILGVCGVRILWIFTAFAATHNAIILYLSYPISWIVTSAIHFICLMILKKKAFAKEKKTAQTVAMATEQNIKVE